LIALTLRFLQTSPPPRAEVRAVAHRAEYETRMARPSTRCRISISDGRDEVAVASSRFHRADTRHSSFAGLAPDGSPLFMQVYKDFDIASIDLEGK
jgi:hypothetical protein